MRGLNAMLVGLVLGGCHLVGGVSDAEFVADGGSAGATASGGAPSAGGSGGDNVGGMGGVADGGQGGTAAGGAMCGFEPPPEGACPAACDECAAGVCVMMCSAVETCAAVTCPEGWPCRVECVGAFACAQASINCPMSHGCTLECMSSRACQDATLRCGDGPCAISCSGVPQTCRDTSVVCGRNDCSATCGNGPQPFLSCDGTGPCACEPCR